MSNTIHSFSIWKFKKTLNKKNLNVCIKSCTCNYMKQSVDMDFVLTCKIIFIPTLSFFNQSVSQKNCKSDWGWNL